MVAPTRQAMTRQSLYFTGPRSLAVREEPVPDPAPDEVRVSVTTSGISPGTELLVYRDDVPTEMSADETIDALDGTFTYPLQYGYAATGQVTAVGSDLDDGWEETRVFAFHPHESHFVADPETLVETTLPPETALFIPNLEAAVNFVMDARPRIGARVVVFGQGPVGLLTTALLAEFPLAELVTVDCYETRRMLSERLGADRSVPPEAVTDAVEGADISIELSGNPEALDDALEVTGFAGQVVVGSWYGTKDIALDLGDAYHRSHIRVQSSQVSRLDPEHTDRWNKRRRLEFVQDLLAETDFSLLLTHSFDITEAAEAYRLLDERKDEAVQVALTYE
jgi:alcohol dehydrogenase